MFKSVLIALFLAATRGDPCVGENMAANCCTDADAMAFWGALGAPDACANNGFTANHALWLNYNSPGICDCANAAVAAGAMQHMGLVNCDVYVPMVGNMNVMAIYSNNIGMCMSAPAP